MAFEHFRRCRVDAAVLEVGLGGRLDSTNVCSPCVAIITSISFDHTKQLGDTLAAIAAEKAGIIKPGVPVISGVDADEPREVIRRIARQRGCRLVELGVDFSFDYHPPHHLEQAAAPAQFDFRYLATADDVKRAIVIAGGQRPAERSRHIRGPLAPAIPICADVALACWAAIKRPMRPWRWRRWKNCGASVGRSPRPRFAADWPKCLAGAGGGRHPAADGGARRRP